MTDETYNGYANQETWAFNLHWQNDQGLYGWVVDITRDKLRDGDTSDRELGEHVIENAQEFWVEALTAPQNHDELIMWMRETGSVWRVDPVEVGEAAREALGIED